MKPSHEQIKEHRQRVWNLTTSCEPIDENKAREAINRLYQALKQPPPKVLFAVSPSTRLALFRWLKGCRDIGNVNILQSTLNEFGGIDSSTIAQLQECTKGSGTHHLPLQNKKWEANWEQFVNSSPFWTAEARWFDSRLNGSRTMYPDPHEYASVLANAIVETEWLSLHGADVCELQCAYSNMVHHSMGFTPMRKVVIIQHRPLEVHLDDRGRLHNESGPAVAWRNGERLYQLHNVACPSWVVEHPERITPVTIDAMNNSEVRREMIARFGIERFVAETFTSPPVVDDWGKLYRRTRGSDSDIVMVKMVNSTPEPDGTFKEYFERVPPTIQTPREALAWQVGLEKAEDYRPAVET